MKNTKVLIYGLNYYPEPIGVGRYTGELAQFLAHREYDVAVITSPPHYPGWRLRGGYRNRFSRVIEGKIEVFRVPVYLRNRVQSVTRIMFLLSFALTSSVVLIWYLLIRRPKIVLCVEPSLMSAPLALLLCKILGIRIVLQVQDLEVEAALATGQVAGKLLPRLASEYAKQVRSRFDQIITISDNMKKSLEISGVPAHRIAVVRNWVKPELFKKTTPIVDYRAKFDIGSAQKVFLYAGNIGKKQGLDKFLDAAKLLQKNCDYVFVISGDGPEKHILERRYGALQNVRFGNLVPEEELNSFLQFADVHVICQLSGTSDLVLPSKVGPILASGGRVIVVSQENTELHRFLAGQAQFATIDNLSSIVSAIRAIADLPDTGCNSRIKLARTLSADLILPQFEEVLMGALLAKQDLHEQVDLR